MLTSAERRTKWHLHRLYNKAGGVERVAAITGSRVSVVSAWRTMGAPNRIPFDALCTLEHAVGDYDCTREHLQTPHEPTPPDLHLGMVSDIARDTADVTDEMIRALEDGVVTPNEAQGIAKAFAALRLTARNGWMAASNVRAAADAAE